MVAVNCLLAPWTTTAEAGLTTMVIGFSETVAEADFVESPLLLAVTMTGPLPAMGAVKTPALVMLPAEALQVTVVSLVLPATMAEKAWVAPWSIVTRPGVMFTATACSTVTFEVADFVGSATEVAAIA
jgi:hypothetical protein